MTDLDKLIEAVEAGWWVGDTTSIFENDEHMNAYKAYHGSLDAAKALKCVLLPNWKWGSVDHGDGEYGAGVGVSEFDEFVSTSNFSEARASLLAILKAYRAQQEVKA